MLAGVLAGIVLYDQRRDGREAAIEQTREAIGVIDREIKLQSALGAVELTVQGHPESVDPAWFKTGLPQNALLGDRNVPWLEVAGPRDRELTHPSQRTVGEAAGAAFWYNPYRGVVRARVPGGLSDASTLDLYNRVNGTSIDSLFTEFRGQ